MTLISGYLPVWLTPKQESEYKRLLEEHYTVDYFDFDELDSIEPVVPPYTYITANISGILVCAFFMKPLHMWDRHTKQDGFDHALSLMKLS